MSRRRKLEKFADLKRFDQVYEMTEPGSEIVIQNLSTQKIMKGLWRSDAFSNEHPLCIELACGRGEYTIALGRKYPETNYIGVDIKGARIWQGATIAREEELENVAFLRIRIEQLVNYFDPEEVDEIWITFPDPFPGKENRRLTSNRFLDSYHRILKKGGIVNFKTDDNDLFEYSLEIARASTKYRLVYNNDNIYDSSLYLEELEIKTYYERQHLSNKKTIKYLQLEKID
ncbi:MAG: tRNA (guanine-N7-)-methyltransferase [Saprospiraceae bacterium]|jgi:tRNA (guanine-N7-)-methyltransferase